MEKDLSLEVMKLKSELYDMDRESKSREKNLTGFIMRVAAELGISGDQVGLDQVLSSIAELKAKASEKGKKKDA